MIYYILTLCGLTCIEGGLAAFALWKWRAAAKDASWFRQRAEADPNAWRKAHADAIRSRILVQILDLANAYDPVNAVRCYQHAADVEAGDLA